MASATNGATNGAEHAEELEARPLQIVRLDMKENQVMVNEENLQILSSNLKKTKAAAVCIVAIMGTYRTGKSFLLGMLMRYLRCWERTEAAEAKRTQMRAEAYKKAHWHAKINEGKSEDDASAAGHAAAHEATKGEEELPKFPTSRNERWTLKGPKFPPPSWLLQGDDGQPSQGLNHGSPGFEWRGGMTKCTEGIWFWSRPYVLPYKGRKVAVVLMDTQGAWDGAMTKEQCATIFGLTALMSSKLICNAPNMLTDDKIDTMDYFTTFAQAACDDLTTDGKPFGHLEFLIRDWSWYEQGFDYDKCKAMSKDHLDNFLHSGLGGRQEAAQRLDDVFSSISCFGLPHPGLEVLDPQFKGDFNVINSDFFQLLDEFTRRFFQSDDFPCPSAPLGNEISPSTFENTLRNYVSAFANNKSSAVHMREAFVKVEIFKHRDLLVEQFRSRLLEVAPEYRAVDPEVFDVQTAQLLAELRKDFECKLKTFKVEDEAHQMEAFSGDVRQLLERRRKENTTELDSAQMKLMASPAVGGGLYVLSGHPYIDVFIVGLGMYWQANRRAAELKKDVLDLEVLTTLCGDVKRFGAGRYRDVQAMSIAAQRCTPNTAMEQVMSKANVAIGAAAKVAATSGVGAAASSSSSGAKVPPA